MQMKISGLSPSRATKIWRCRAAHLGFHSLGKICWEVGEDQLQGPEHSQHALRGAVQISADVVVQLVQRDLCVIAGDANFPAHVLDGL